MCMPTEGKPVRSQRVRFAQLKCECPADTHHIKTDWRTELCAYLLCLRLRFRHRRAEAEEGAHNGGAGSIRNCQAWTLFAALLRDARHLRIELQRGIVSEGMRTPTACIGVPCA